MRKTTLAYLAGVMDGEGCIAITKLTSGVRQGRRRTFKSPEYRILISVSMCDREPVAMFRKTFGGYLYRRKRRRRDMRPIWHWIVIAGKCRRILRVLLPFLLAKRRQAKLALKYCDQIGAVPHPGCKGLPGRAVLARERLFQRMRHLKNANRFGHTATERAP